MNGIFRAWVAAALLLQCLAAPGLAAEDAAAIVMRIEPADTGIAKVLRDGRSEEVAFMMPLYEGDQLVVESPNTTVQVRVFGGDDVTASVGEPLTIGAGTKERTMLGGMLSALSERVFRNNQLSRRNLVTRSDGGSPALVLYGFAAGEAQKLAAGRRSLILLWNRDLDAVDYRIEDIGTGRELISGTAHGDHAFIESAHIEAGHEYAVLIRRAGIPEIRGVVVAVDARPDLTPVDEGLGAAGPALQLVELAGREGGSWKLEAIQRVLDLSPEDIDRATLIEEIAAL